ncbi:Oxidoreductase domain protein [Candidatus Sulfopaludibacter sp. SbA4]|nr:Oxidoreductase domain protein [Candidatus Sulfopaludibacter sp. SbA4]
MSTTRRHFLGTAAGVTLAAEMQAQQNVSPNDRVRVALIGNGIQGSGDARTSLATGSVELVAVADVYEGRLTKAKEVWGSQVFTTRDYREVLARKDVDAVIVATPDHWHRKIAVDAMNAGKDVYCEKPMVQLVDDGKEVIDTEKRTGRILQVGSQRVSSVIYQKAKELLERGAIGELNMVEAWVDRNSAIGAWQYSIPPDASTSTIDWDRFLGRAPKIPFEPIRLFRWRNYRDYGTGVGGDLFVHLFTGIHFVLGAIGPTRVFTTGGLRFWKDGRDVPDVMLGLYDYPARGKFPAFNLSLRVDFVDGATETQGFRFVGSEGILTIGNGVTVSKMPREAEPGQTADTFSKAIEEQYMREYRAKYPVQRPTADSMRPQGDEVYLPPRGYSDWLDHHRNFISAVKSRRPVIEDATFGFRAAGPALLSNISYFEQRVCLWDPETMTLKG